MSVLSILLGFIYVGEQAASANLVTQSILFGATSLGVDGKFDFFQHCLIKQRSFVAFKWSIR